MRGSREFCNSERSTANGAATGLATRQGTDGPAIRRPEVEIAVVELGEAQALGDGVVQPRHRVQNHP